MTKPNTDIQKLLDDTVQLEAAFMLAEQLDEKKNAIPREFALHVVEFLNQKLQATGLYQKPWIASLEPGNEYIYGIGVDGAFGSNYRCVVENYFKGWINVGWRNASQGTLCENPALQNEMVKQTRGKTENNWWLCVTEPFT
ncbi:hypothetical protein, partial [Escherichia coli]|uniref:hypothetical protein n=1 Tax=Escherichia coli TaxID=562 RepID=UPI00129049C8